MQSLEDIINEEMALAVERIVRASRSTALTAFDRHFEHLGQRPLRQPASPSGRATSINRVKNRVSPRRSAEKIAELEARFLGVVRSQPGQPMSALAPLVGVKSSELQVPVARLKAANKLKTVGQRHLVRYFPVDGEIAA